MKNIRVELLKDSIVLAARELEQTARDLAFDALFQLLPISFYWIDKNGILLGCNQQVATALNYANIQDIIGKHTSEVVTADGWNNCQKVLTSGEKLIAEEQHTSSDGQIITFLSIKSPILGTDNSVLGLIGVSIDITDRKNMEQALIEAKIAAEAANHAKTEFLINISHDIRTPLNGILGYAQILHARETQQQKKEDLEVILNSSIKLSTLLTDIIELSNFEINGLPLKNNTFNLSVILTDIKQLFAAQTRSKNINLIFEVTPDVPALLIGDETRLHRILINLIGNALKFTNEGQVSLAINSQSIAPEKVLLELIVSDTGIGIPEDKLTIIFDRFQRLTGTSYSQFPGNGLGLYIVKKFIEEMQGTITVSSTVGKGTVFKCLIPLILANT